MADYEREILEKVLIPFFVDKIKNGNYEAKQKTEEEGQKANKLAVSIKLKEKGYGFYKFLETNKLKNQIEREVDLKPSELEFDLEYTADKGLLMVRLKANMVLNVETTDFLLYQANKLTYSNLEVCPDYV